MRPLLLLLICLCSSVLNAGDVVPLNARIEGLALGNTVEVERSGVVTVVRLNGPIALGSAPAGTPLSIQIRMQPRGQVCQVSERAPALVPIDSAPVFIRCRHVPTPRISVPLTRPDAPLSFWLDGAGLRSIAYPGLPYESRPGVRGGQFPYEFRLLGVTSPGNVITPAMVGLDFRRGTLHFTPPQAGEYRFQIEVRDSSATPRVLTREFIVQSNTTSFLFVAPNGIDAVGRGSIDLPFRTIAFAMAQSNPNHLLMLRRGRYPERFTIGDSNAHQVLAFPDEIVEIDLNGLNDITLRFDTGPTARLEGLDLTNARQYAIVSDPSKPGAVLRLMQFRDATVANAGENPAFVHGWGDGSPETRHRLLIQDTEFGHYPGGYATTLFDAGDSVFENNQVRLGASENGLHDKDNAQRNVYRENFIEYAPEFRNNNGIQLSAQSNSELVHIHHNLIINSGVLLGGQCVQSDCYMRDHDVHHNTLVNGAIVLRWGVFNPTSRDTRSHHNLIRNTEAPYAWASCLNTVPAAFVPQFQAGANRIETSNANAMRDTECGGSPMNMTWTIWRDVHGLDTIGSGAVLSATSDLTGQGALTQLSQGDPRVNLIGHRYALPDAIGSVMFADGFEP